MELSDNDFSTGLSYLAFEEPVPGLCLGWPGPREEAIVYVSFKLRIFFLLVPEVMRILTNNGHKHLNFKKNVIKKRIQP